MQKLRRRLLLFLLFTVSLFHLCPTPAAAVQPINADFITKSCDTTRDPQICSHFLSPYVRIIQRSPERLVRVSIVVCHSRVKPSAAYISSLYRHVSGGGSRNPFLVRVLQACSENFYSAVGELEESMRQMRKLRSSADIASVEHPVLAAVGHVATCVYGLGFVPNWPEKSDVVNRSTEVMKLARIVLSFVEELRSSPNKT